MKNLFEVISVLLICLTWTVSAQTSILLSDLGSSNLSMSFTEEVVELPIAVENNDEEVEQFNANILADEECITGCSQKGKSAAKKMWDKFGVFPANITKQDWKKKWRIAVKAFNAPPRVAGTFGIAPGATHTDSFEGTNSRIDNSHVLTFAPALLKSKKFRVKKTNQSVNAEAVYTFCTVTKSGRVEYKGQISFPADDPSATRDITISNTRGKVVIIVIENQNGAGTSLTYQVIDATNGY